MRAAIAGSIVLLLLANNPQAYRLELVLVPSAAVGLAVLAQHVWSRRAAATLA